MPILKSWPNPSSHNTPLPTRALQAWAFSSHRAQKHPHLQPGELRTAAGRLPYSSATRPHRLPPLGRRRCFCPTPPSFTGKGRENCPHRPGPAASCRTCPRPRSPASAPLRQPLVSAASGLPGPLPPPAPPAGGAAAPPPPSPDGPAGPAPPRRPARPRARPAAELRAPLCAVPVAGAASVAIAQPSPASGAALAYT